MARHAVITFLEDHEALYGVDSDFRKLVEVLHWIPFCASFGVSCSGHFREDDENSSFCPSPWGHLDVIVLPSMPHIKEFLQLVARIIGNHSDATFKKIQHVFGPPTTSQLEVWEIRVNDNGCLGEFEEDIILGTEMLKSDNELLYRDSKKRCEEIRFFWEDLTTQLTTFCREHGFKEEFALEKRMRELASASK